MTVNTRARSTAILSSVFALSLIVSAPASAVTPIQTGGGGGLGNLISFACGLADALSGMPEPVGSIAKQVAEGMGCKGSGGSGSTPPGGRPPGGNNPAPPPGDQRPPGGGDPAPLPPSGSQIEEMLNQHNRIRASVGAPPLKLDECITNRIAQEWANHMANRISMYHQNIYAAGKKCNLYAVAENIAMGQRDVTQAVTAWKNSPGHYRNMTNPRYTKAGFGIAKSSRGTLFWCANFS